MSALSVKKPKKTCNDSTCPFHGIVRRDYLNYVAKYRRYERRRSNVAAHSPPCLEIKAGDRVKLAECRPISKTVAFVVIEKLEEGTSGSKS
jgi:small subunit ribosomal protein S17